MPVVEKPVMHLRFLRRHLDAAKHHPSSPYLLLQLIMHLRPPGRFLHVTRIWLQAPPKPAMRLRLLLRHLDANRVRLSSPYRMNRFPSIHHLFLQLIMHRRPPGKFPHVTCIWLQSPPKFATPRHQGGKGAAVHLL